MLSTSQQLLLRSGVHLGCLGELATAARVLAAWGGSSGAACQACPQQPQHSTGAVAARRRFGSCAAAHADLRAQLLSPAATLPLPFPALAGLRSSADKQEEDGSDDETQRPPAPTAHSSGGEAQGQQQQLHHHHVHHAHRPRSAAHHHHHHHHRTTQYQGQLHASHRRHAASGGGLVAAGASAAASPASAPASSASSPSSSSSAASGGSSSSSSGASSAAPGAPRLRVDAFLSQQLLSATGLGVLRRVMIRYKANFEPEHVANTLLALQHHVQLQQARNARSSGGASAAGGVHGRVTAERGGLARVTPRAAESEGPLIQLTGQMLGELGAMIWQMMADMSGADLAKVLYSWAALDWHPEPKLLADVRATFLAVAAAAAAGARLEQQAAREAQALLTEAPRDAWLAAGLWGLLKLVPLCDDAALELLQRHWAALLAAWTPQQLVDVAGALLATADEGIEDEVLDVLAGLVIDLAERLVAQLQRQEVQQQEGAWRTAQQHHGLLRAASVTGAVPLPWPGLLVPAAAATRSEQAGAPPAQQQRQQQQQQASADFAVTAVSGPQQAWRMLQALAATGVPVSEPTDARTGSLVAALQAAMAQPQQGR